MQAGMSDGHVLPQAKTLAAPSCFCSAGRILQDTGETLHGMPHHPIPCLAQVRKMKMGSLPPQRLWARVLAWHSRVAHKGWVTIEMRLTRLVP